MTAPRMTDEASAPKRMSEEEFRITVRPLDQETPGQTMARRGRLLAEARRARSSEAALLARVERLEGALRAAAERLGDVGHDSSCSARIYSSTHPSVRPACDCGHEDAAQAVDAALSEKP